MDTPSIRLNRMYSLRCSGTEATYYANVVMIHSLAGTIICGVSGVLIYGDDDRYAERRLVKTKDSAANFTR